MNKKSDISDEDIALFRKAVEGTNRSHRNYQAREAPPKTRRNKPTRPPSPFPSMEEPESTNIQATAIDTTDQEGDEILFVRAGLQKKGIRRLKRGEFPYQGVLDLHGMRAHQIEALLEDFLTQSLHAGHACVLIIYGKGYRSAEGRGVIKPATIKWLKEQREVRAFCSAQPRDGGTGAAYVLLKARAQPSDR